MEHEQTEQLTFVEQLLQLIEQIISPDWAGLIALVPLLFIVLLVVILGMLAWQWRRVSARNRPRVARRLAAGAPPPGVHLPGPSRWPFVLPVGAALMLFALILPARDETGQVTFPANLPLLGLGLLVTLVAIGGWLLDAMREWRATARTGEAVPAALTQGTPFALPAAAGSGAATTRAARRQAPAEPPPGVHMPGPSPWPFFAPIGMAIVFFGLILNPLLIVVGLAMAVLAAGGWYAEASHEYRTTEALGHPVPKTRDPDKAWPRRLVRTYAVLAALGVLVLVVPAALQWLGSFAPPPPGQETPGQETPGVPAVPEVTAQSAVSFETDLLVVPCCRDFELIFHNEDAGVPHDVAITAGEGGDTLFDGDIIEGPADITYEVPALDEGEYYFLCTVHPNMNGTVQAQPEDAGPDGQPGADGQDGAEPGGNGQDGGEPGGDGQDGGEQP